MDQNWNNGPSGAMPAPNMNMDPNAVPNNGAYTQQAPQAPQAQAPNMNMGGSAPVVNQPGVVQAPVPPVVADQRGGKSSLLETIILVVVCLIAAVAIVVAVIFFMRYDELQKNTNSQVEAAKSAAITEQSAVCQDKLKAQEVATTTEFTGPSVYGSISFEYPKTWSVYVSKDASNNGDYEAIFHPGGVINNKNERYALHFAIKARSFDVVSDTYNKKVKNGKMKSNLFTVGDNISGTRYEGEITSNINGVVVLFSVNDKTAIMQTDALSNKDNVAAFEAILKSLRRNS